MVLDVKGKLLGRVFIPFKEKKPGKTFEKVYPFTIKRGKFYQVVDNEETGEWELHITGISLPR